MIYEMHTFLCVYQKKWSKSDRVTEALHSMAFPLEFLIV